MALITLQESEINLEIYESGENKFLHSSSSYSVTVIHTVILTAVKKEECCFSKQTKIMTVAQNIQISKNSTVFALGMPFHAKTLSNENERGNVE